MKLSTLIAASFISLTAPIQSYADTFSDAVAAFKDGHFSTAYGLFYGLVQKEHALAQLNIATMTAKGDGIIQSDKDALFWAWRALGRHKPSYSHNPISDIADNTTIAMQQKVRAAEAKLEGELQRTATVEELAQHMEMNQAELESWQARFQASKVKSLDEVYTDHSLLFEDVTPSPEEATHQSQLRAMLKKALSRLPEREALLLQLYYVEELNVYEVSAILGVTTGRVSQIKRAAIERAHSLIMDQMDG